MKKSYLALGLLLMISELAFCVEQKVFLGIPWGSSLETAKAALDAKGYTIFKEEKNQLTYRGEKFVGRTAAGISLYFSDDKFYQAIVIILPADNSAMESYASLKSDLEIACGPPDSVERKFESPYKESDGNEEKALMENKAEINTIWKFTNNRQIRLRASFNKDVQRISIILYYTP